MDVYALNGLNGVVDLISEYESLIWAPQYFGKGEFQMTLSADHKALTLLTAGRYLCRACDVTADGFNNVMIVENVELKYDSEKGWIMTATGKGLKSILGRRIVWAQTTMTGTVENAIRQVITENIISPTDTARRIQNFTLDTAQGFTETADIQLFGENVADWLESTCKEYGFGWDVIIKNGGYLFKLYKGADRSAGQSVLPAVIFSPEYDNLLSSNYSYNMIEFKNAALIGGEGEGTAKRTASIGTAAGLERFEAYIDGGNVSSNGEIITEEQYIELLKNYGLEQLSDTAFVEKISGEIDSAGMYKLNEDYFLGDIVQINNGRGINAVARITEIIYAIDENGISVVPTFTEWEVE